ncbi:hypothetical protein TPHV1_10147 [Treponema phagedenis]|uniref:Uncharacterized protein n=1 Tax=Treponema phagedenis TaxID=162 RepID=A0A0B7GPJ6_TREPH|nr:hypothetical protein TPHV1_10147 [Treponema phagedenis]
MRKGNVNPDRKTRESISIVEHRRQINMVLFLY